MSVELVEGKNEINGKDIYQLQIDKSDRKHQNRVFTVTAAQSPLDGEWRITFKVEGIKYHPDIILTKDEYNEFIKCASELKAKID